MSRRLPSFLMVAISVLLNINYAILRSLRNTLAVADLGWGAKSIPLFELLGALPGAILVTWGLNRLLNRYSIPKTFQITLTFFLTFFFLFVTIIYPQLRESSEGVAHFWSMIFYVVSELWKPALMIVLFWALINHHVSSEHGKTIFPLILLGGSLGSILAGPLTAVCTSDRLWHLAPLFKDRWSQALYLLIAAIVVIGAVIALLYWWLAHLLSKHKGSTCRPDLPFTDLIISSWRDLPIRSLGWMVAADYIAYSLGEVIFLHVLHLRYPAAADYCHYLGYLTFWCGVLTIFGNLVVAPLVLHRCRWLTAALAAPLALLIIEGLFFLFLRVRFFTLEAEWLAMVSLLGSVQYCLCRAVKYSLFDSSKELAFVALPERERIRGKLVVDGLCARLGRGVGSILSLSLIALCGGTLASSLPTGIVALTMALSWVRETYRLDRLLTKRVTP